MRFVLGQFENSIGFLFLVGPKARQKRTFIRSISRDERKSGRITEKCTKNTLCKAKDRLIFFCEKASMIKF